MRRSDGKKSAQGGGRELMPLLQYAGAVAAVRVAAQRSERSLSPTPTANVVITGTCSWEFVGDCFCSSGQRCPGRNGVIVIEEGPNVDVCAGDGTLSNFSALLRAIKRLRNLL
jgi:hypothetical protein